MSKAFPTCPSQEPHICEQEGNLTAAQYCAIKKNCLDTAKYLTAFPQLLLGAHCSPSVLHICTSPLGMNTYVSLSAPDLCLESPLFLICQCFVWLPSSKDPQDMGKHFRGSAEMHQQSPCWIFKCFSWVFLSYVFFNLAGCWPFLRDHLAATARVVRDVVMHFIPLLAT